MAQIEIISEKEQAGGWRFAVQMLDDTGELHRCELTLSWADYNHWSASGADEPARVAEAVMQFLTLRTEPRAIRPFVDASTVRRMHADADAAIPGLISPH